MSLPGFAAECSLFRTHQHYRMGAIVAVLGDAGKVVPKQTTDCVSGYGTPQGARLQPTLSPRLPRNGGGNGGCQIDCTACDRNCRKTCTNSCTGRSVTLSCCTLGFSCQNGRCVCPSPKTLCGSVCTDTSSDPNNCSQCGVQCRNGQTCQQGGCFPTPPVCGPCQNGFMTCCSFVSPDQRQCGVSACCASGEVSCNGTCCATGQICCTVDGNKRCVTPGSPRDGFSWCGQSYPTVIECDCPPGFTCGSICGGQLCSVDWYCQPA